jgi:hypothetical protein
MAKTFNIVTYLGSMQAVKDVTYNSTDIKDEHPTANCIIMKTIGVKVSVNGTALFDVSLDDQSFLENGHTYRFNKDCVIAIGKYTTL